MMNLEQLRESVKLEPLTQEELTELLRRVGEREMGGSDAPTIGAVCEATGSDPLELARILQDIRSGAEEEQLTAHVERLETKIDRLSESLKQRPTPEVRVVEVPKSAFNSYADTVAPRLDPEIDPESRLVGAWIAIVVFIVVGLLFFAVASRSARTHTSGFPMESKCFRTGANGRQEEIPCSFPPGMVPR